MLSELHFDDFRLSPRPLSRSTSKLANISTDFNSESDEEELETRPLTLSSRISSLSASPKSLKQSIGEMEETKMQFEAIKREAELLLQSDNVQSKVSFTSKVTNFLLMLFKASLIISLFGILFFLDYCIRSPAAQPIFQAVMNAETWDLSGIILKLFNPNDLTAHFAGYFGWFLNWLEEWKHIVPS